MHDQRIIFIAGAFAVYRLAQLLVYDDGPLDCFILLRSFVDHSQADGQKRSGLFWESLGKLINCPYCIGVWFAFIVSLITAIVLDHSVAEWFLWAMGFAGIQTWLEIRAGDR